MAKADFTLPTGASVTIDGTPEEVAQLLDHYLGSTLAVARERRPAPGFLQPAQPAATRNGRLGAYALLGVALLVGTLVMGYLSFRLLSGGLGGMYSEVVLPRSYLAQAQVRLERVLGDVSGFVYAPETRGSSQAALEADMSELERQMALYRDTVATADEQALFAQFDQAWAAYRAGVGRALTLAQGEDQAVAAQSLAESLPAAQAAQATLAQADALTLRQAEALNQQGKAQLRSVATLMGLMGVMNVFLIGVLVVFLLRRGR